MSAKRKSANIEVNPSYTQLTKSYYSDITSPDMIFVKIVRSPVARGTIKSITLDEIPDGFYFFTAKDFGDENYIETLDIQTELLASTQVHYKGEPIAIVAGPAGAAVDELLQSVKINIEKEPVSKTKEKEYPYAQRFIRTGKAQKPEEFSKLFSKKNFDVKGNWTSVLNAPSCNEPSGAFCNYDKKVLTIYTPTQWPKHLQESLKRIFGLKSEEIFIKKTITTGPHTNTIWINTILTVFAALVSIRTHKPAKLILSRFEQAEYMTKKSPISVKIRTAVKKDGLIEANQILIDLDSGYHNPFAAEILDRLIIAANNIYAVRNLEIVAKAYESYNPPVSFNTECIDSQAFFAMENQIQKICRTTGFLPAEFRIKNFERKISMPFSFQTERVTDCFNAIAKQSDLNRKFVSYQLESNNRIFSNTRISNIPLRGIGITAGFNGIGYYGSNIFACNQKIEATLEQDGGLVIHALPPSDSTLEIWKNSAAGILGIESKQIKLNSTFAYKEELSVPDSIYSNLTIMNSLLKKCCLDIQSKRYRKPLPITSSKGITASQKKAWNKEKFSGVPFFGISFGTVIVEVEVDPCTYRITIKKVHAIINAGKISIPKIAENSVKLSIQHALSELMPDDILECNNISIAFVTSENESMQIDGLISKLLPAAFTSALSQALGHEINTLPVKAETIFKELTSNENTGNSK